MSAESDFENRLVQLEMLLMHVQRELEQCGQVLLGQQAEIDGLKGTLSRVTAMLDEGPAEPRDPQAEVPPHY